MNTVLRTAVFDKWLSQLKDLRGNARVIKRIRDAERGNFGDCKYVGNGVSEMRVHFGPGYRLYFCRKAKRIVVLLWGGKKRNQKRDIARAQELARGLMED